eukprot:scaffold51322_cov31-Phaeocystis_antarctica.AAC.2
MLQDRRPVHLLGVELRLPQHVRGRVHRAAQLDGQVRVALQLRAHEVVVPELQVAAEHGTHEGDAFPMVLHVDRRRHLVDE